MIARPRQSVLGMLITGNRAGVFKLWGGPGGMRGTIVGSTAPLAPSAADLVRGARTLCRPGVRLHVTEGPLKGDDVAVDIGRLRELNRPPRGPLEPGFRGMPWPVVQEMAAEARAALAQGDIEGSDAARMSTLPFPHRAGSSPCSGARRPAAIARDVQDWRDGEAFDQLDARAMLARVRALLPRAERPKVNSLADLPASLQRVEGACVKSLEDWAERASVRTTRRYIEERKAARAMYRKQSG